MAAPRKTTARKVVAKKTEAAPAPELVAVNDPAAEVAEPAADVVDVNLAAGDKGDRVSFVQDTLGVTGEKTFGPVTEKAVKRWQKARGYRPDGVLTPRQYRQMRATVAQD